MRATTIARNYAETLFTLGERAGGDRTRQYAELLDALAGAIESDESIRLVLESPRVPKAAKAELLGKALEGRAPVEFIRFLDAVVQRGRQALLPVMSTEFQSLVDVKFNRVHAGVVLARPADERLKEAIATRLSEVLNKEVLVHLREDPAILGGIVVRVGDRVMDGSVRRKLIRLRRQMLGA